MFVNPFVVFLRGFRNSLQLQGRRREPRLESCTCHPTLTSAFSLSAGTARTERSRNSAARYAPSNPRPSSSFSLPHTDIPDIVLYHARHPAWPSTRQTTRLRLRTRQKTRRRSRSASVASGELRRICTYRVAPRRIRLTQFLTPQLQHALPEGRSRQLLPYVRLPHVPVQRTRHRQLHLAQLTEGGCTRDRRQRLGRGGGSNGG